MPHQITIQPSGRKLTVSSNQTILNAAIDEGIHLPYGCRNGACGACKGKIIEGSIDYGSYQSSALSDNEKANGYALFCCASAQSDLTIECREVDSLNGIKPRILPTRVQTLEKLSHDVMLMKLKLPSNERMQFVAGQYIEFLLKDGKRRAFSLANAPHNDEFLELHLRLIPGGAFTHYVFNEMQEKTILRIEGPFGSFFLREESGKPVIFVAGGTGFAPIKGIIEHMLHHQSKREIKLYWGGCNLQDFYMLPLPQVWAAQNAHLQFIPVLSEPQNEDAWQGRTGLVHQAVLDDFADLSDYQIYCCGAPAMVDTVYLEFQKLGMPKDAFFSDAFTFANPTTKT